MIFVGWQGDSLFSAQVDIIHPVTFHAVDVIMLMEVPVEPFLPAADFQFLDQACLGHDFQVAIDRGQADPGQFFLDPLVELIGGGVNHAFFDLSQDDFPLMGHTK